MADTSGMRVVSLTCSNTEIVCALGCADMLVGVDDHSDHPLDVVARLPRAGPDLQIDVQRVAALRPDLVLASLTVPGHERAVESLAAAALPWMATEPVCVEDVYADVAMIARALGVADRTAPLVAALRAELDPPADDGAPRPTILVEWWPKPIIVPGGRSWVAQLLAAAGARGPLDGEHVKSRRITDDEARAFDPDAVVISWCGAPVAKYRPDVVRRRKGRRTVRAVAKDHVYCVAEAYLGRPRPRFVEGVRALRRIARASNARS